VCQTRAYAHSKGVLHRDLKPANVMVGAFGEVQVVDWGLAKVLPAAETRFEKRARQTNISIIETVRSEPGSHGSNSLAGSVMGTPAYMSPEQARGDIEKVNERSDVFSLGAVLCEILTGLPPYTGEAEKTLVEAANARLDDATKRLDGCEADAELVALCRECLAPAPSARPRNAEVVAQRIHEHLVSVEERAHLAQIDAAQARVKAREERRARKLTVGLAGSVLTTLVLAGGGWAWTRSEREARLRHTTEQVNAALADAGLARGAKDWSAAHAAIARASASLETGQASDELRSRVSSASIDIEADASAARAALAQQARNAAFLERLDRLRHVEHGSFALTTTEESGASGVPAATSRGYFEQREAAYRAAFAAYDLDVDLLPDTDVIESLRTSGIASSLASAFDDWAAVRADVDNGFKEPSKRLVRIAMDADPDPWRRELRTAILADDPAPLLAFAASAEEHDLPPVTAVVLARALTRVQRGEESLAVLQRAVQRNPADFPLLLQFGQQLLNANPIRLDEALRYLTAARALRPDSGSALVLLSIGMHNAGEADQAFWMARESLRLDPADAVAAGLLGFYAHDQGHLDESVEYCRKAIEIDPTITLAFTTLSKSLVEKGDLDAALAIDRRAIEIDPGNSRLHGNLGVLLAMKGDFDAAIASERKAIELDPTCAIWHSNLGSDLRAKGDIEAAIASYRKAVELDPRLAKAHSNLGFALFTKGDVDAAIASYREAIAIDPREARSFQNLGLALARKGDVDAAIKCWRKAIELDPRYGAPYISLGSALHDKGDFDGAIAALRKGLELDPKDARGANALAWLLATCADPTRRNGAEAVRFARQAVELAPDAFNCNTLGAALCCAEEWGKAIEALDRSNQLVRVDNETGRYVKAVNQCFLAMAHAHLGELDEARAELGLATAWHEAHPKHAGAAQTLRFLDEARAAIEAGANR
jgi:serine/threonine-protein kinase